MRALQTIVFWLAILAIAAVFAFGMRGRFSQSTEGYPANPKADINGGFKSALEQYQVDNGHFPETLEDLLKQPANATNWHGPYLLSPGVPIDPWGKPYVYRCPGQHNPDTYDLLSAGPDGKVGTSDDIGNW